MTVKAAMLSSIVKLLASSRMVELVRWFSAFHDGIERRRAAGGTPCRERMTAFSTFAKAFKRQGWVDIDWQRPNGEGRVENWSAVERLIRRGTPTGGPAKWPL